MAVLIKLFVEHVLGNHWTWAYSSRICHLQYALVVKYLIKDPVLETLIIAGAQNITTSGTVRKDSFLFDFVMTMNIIFFVSTHISVCWKFLFKMHLPKCTYNILTAVWSDWSRNMLLSTCISISWRGLNVELSITMHCSGGSYCSIAMHVPECIAHFWNEIAFTAKQNHHPASFYISPIKILFPKAKITPRQHCY